MCGPFGSFLFGSFWWMFPLAGMLICIGFVVCLSRFSTTGGGCMSMGGNHGERKHQGAETRG